MLSMLAGPDVTLTLRHCGDGVLPELLDMSRIVSETPYGEVSKQLTKKKAQPG
jgi:hypothetical protein